MSEDTTEVQSGACLSKTQILGSDGLGKLEALASSFLRPAH